MNSSLSPCGESHRLVAKLAHRRVVDQSVDVTVDLEDRFQSATYTSTGLRRGGATASLSLSDVCLGLDRACPRIRQSRNSAGR
jgi:hypothetical protein